MQTYVDILYWCVYIVSMNELIQRKSCSADVRVTDISSPHKRAVCPPSILNVLESISGSLDVDSNLRLSRRAALLIYRGYSIPSVAHILSLPVKSVQRQVNSELFQELILILKRKSESGEKIYRVFSNKSEVQLVSHNRQIAGIQ